MTEYFDRIFPALLCSGVSAADFEKMTYGEINAAARYMGEKDVNEAKRQAVFDYLLAAQIARRLHGKSTEFDEFYSWLFEGSEQKAEVRRALAEEQRLMRYFEHACGGVITKRGDGDGGNDRHTAN